MSGASLFVLQTVSQQTTLQVLPALASHVTVQYIIQQSDSYDGKPPTHVR